MLWLTFYRVHINVHSHKRWENHNRLIFVTFFLIGEIFSLTISTLCLVGSWFLLKLWNCSWNIRSIGTWVEYKYYFALFINAHIIPINPKGPMDVADNSQNWMAMGPMGMLSVRVLLHKTQWIWADGWVWLFWPQLHWARSKNFEQYTSQK